MEFFTLESEDNIKVLWQNMEYCDFGDCERGNRLEKLLHKLDQGVDE